ncbi:MAG: Phosphoglycolate phosphatase (EC [uncultured Sulfurovum sp.]|uniref:phosphoglycolate phosphatase n=1 Tax=uncultured Sulfurovum sp. TaxID=269237 RepID=A0A6S6SAN2_9BACT|nr:MAG: Phosphoglycolate phosphatase (EC [uncultured Sulfurovum sp.]
MSSNTIYQLKEDQLRSKIILFDLDGTLIDSTEAILESFSKAYTKFNVEVPADEKIKPLIGLPLETMFITLGVDKTQAMEYVTAYKEHYRTIHTEKTVLLPEVKKTLEIAHECARLGVVTTKTGKYSRELLEHFDLMKYFDVLIGSEDVENHKPHPEPIVKALHSLGYSYGTVTYMIGDTITDILAAQEADIASIGVLSGYGNPDELEEEADFVTKNAFDAVKIIGEL